MPAPAAPPPSPDEVFALIYERLRTRAGQLMSRERRDHTLQATALVHEAYMRVAQSPTEVAGSLGLIGRVMRQVLVDHVRTRDAQIRGGSSLKLPLDVLADGIASRDGVPVDVLDIDEQLSRLARTAPLEARALESTFFAFAINAEVAAELGVSEDHARELRHSGLRKIGKWMGA